jgi:hypothetical protein
VALGDFPLNITLPPQGRFAAVLRCGHGRLELAVVDLEEAKVVSYEPVPEAFYGLEFSRSGARLYCSGAADEVIHVFDFEDGKLRANQRVPLRDARERGIPCGLGVSRRDSGLIRLEAIGFGESIQVRADSFKEDRPSCPQGCSGRRHRHGSWPRLQCYRTLRGGIEPSKQGFSAFEAQVIRVASVAICCQDSTISAHLR